MGVKIGINGFGRIGRMVVRAITSKKGTGGGGKCEKKNASNAPQIVAINDPFMEPKHMAYCLKYDSTHGRFKQTIKVEDKALYIDGQPICLFAEKDAKSIPWKNADVQCVLECTGKNTTIEKAKQHIRDTVKTVVISAPSKDAPMYVMGVNHHEYKAGTPVISNASCTTNCLAPLCKVLHKHFEIQYGLMTTIHAVTASQLSLDGPKKTWRLGRGGWQSIIPASTGAAKAIGKVIPDLNGKLTGTSCRVPVPTGSLVDLTVQLNKKATYEEIKKVMKEAANGDMAGILGYSEEPLVSADIIGDSHSSIFDASAGIALTDCFIKLMSWYDNEWGYSNRLVELASHVANIDAKGNKTDDNKCKKK